MQAPSGSVPMSMVAPSYTGLPTPFALGSSTLELGLEATPIMPPAAPHTPLTCVVFLGHHTTQCAAHIPAEQKGRQRRRDGVGEVGQARLRGEERGGRVRGTGSEPLLSRVMNRLRSAPVPRWSDALMLL